jgi:hypothetical protein
MITGHQEFERQLKEQGYEPFLGFPPPRVAFEYEIPRGAFKGLKVKIGLEVPPDFPLTPPTGLHISPCLLPFNPNGSTHKDRTAPSGFGSDWQYLSRPFVGWKVASAVPRYLIHIDWLLETIR